MASSQQLPCIPCYLNEAMAARHHAVLCFCWMAMYRANGWACAPVCVVEYSSFIWPAVAARGLLQAILHLPEGPNNAAQLAPSVQLPCFTFVIVAHTIPATN
jgi:hypothetical protein